MLVFLRTRLLVHTLSLFIFSFFWFLLNVSRGCKSRHPLCDFMAECQGTGLSSACCRRIYTRRMKQPNCVSWMRGSLWCFWVAQAAWNLGGLMLVSYGPVFPLSSNTCFNECTPAPTAGTHKPLVRNFTSHERLALFLFNVNSNWICCFVQTCAV
jgi:hypothetical protein